MRVIVVAVSDEPGSGPLENQAALARAVAEILTASTSALPHTEASPASERANGNRLARLTPREIDVLRLMSQGLGNGEIARRLFISEKTAKAHASHIFEKLDVATRVQAVLAAKDALARDLP